MIPIFFNAQSHLWIVYLLLANGWLLMLGLRACSAGFRDLSASLESQILSAFFLSIALNGTVMLALDCLMLPFSLALSPLIMLSLALVCLLWCWRMKISNTSALAFEISWPRLALYGFVFLMLFYNGGLIDQIADSWWHMSLANKIALESSFSPSAGHLTGLPSRYYPPLWHANLALMQQLSGIPIDVFWNSFTAWGAVFKVMAFYLMALGLCKNKNTALLAALLFVLLPGAHMAYIRVSVWPSHISYTTWYVMFYIALSLLDNLPDLELGIKRSSAYFLTRSRALIASLLVLGAIVFFVHQAEVLWFAVACFCYLIAASLSRLFKQQQVYIAERDHIILRGLYWLGLWLLLAVAAYFAVQHEYPVIGFSDRLLANVLPLFILLSLLVIEWQCLPRKLQIAAALSLFAVLLMAINYSHLYSLFFPEYALPKGEWLPDPVLAIGYFGGELDAPNWQYHLRSGLLYSGILAVIIAAIGVCIKPNRATIFLSGTALVALLFCASPYLYHWLTELLNYHSPWRISLLIFHPIVWAMVLTTLFNAAKVGTRRAQ